MYRFKPFTIEISAREDGGSCHFLNAKYLKAAKVSRPTREKHNVKK